MSMEIDRDSPDPRGLEWLLYWTLFSGGLIWIVPIALLVWWLT